MENRVYPPENPKKDEKTVKVGETSLIDELPLPAHPGVVEPIVAAGEMQSVLTDPQGSYTGNPIDGGVPVQDADDL